MAKYRRHNYDKQDGKCLWCGKKMIPQWDVSLKNAQKVEGLPEWAYTLPDGHLNKLKKLYTSVEHIKPTSKGGKNVYQNYAVAHVVCNGERNLRMTKPHPEVLKSFPIDKQNMILEVSNQRKKIVRAYGKNISTIRKALVNTKHLMSNDKKEELTKMFIKHFSMWDIVKAYTKMKLGRK